MKKQQSKRKRVNGKFVKNDPPPSKEKPKQAVKPKPKPIDQGDDIETLNIQRVDNVTTVTAKNEQGRIVKAFVQDASRYVIGQSHDFRIARNGAYHEIEPPPPVKTFVDYSEWMSKDG
jgi:N-acetyl-gamma-glutamylphosphate reductase